VALDVHGSGDRRSGALNGSIDLNDYHLLLQPLQARFDEDFKTLTLQQLSVASSQIKGTVNASGTIQLDARPISGDLAIAWKDLELPANLVGQELDSHGNLTFRGSAKQYHAEGDVDIGPPRKLAKLALNLDGTPQQILLHTLKLQQPQGDLDANGTLSLQPQLAWQFQAVTHQFDPGQLLFGWQGSLNTDFSTKGILASSGPDVTLELRKLDGQWLHRPVHGDGHLHLSPNRVVDGTLNLASGGSSVQVKAKPGDSNNADVTLAIASLSDCLARSIDCLAIAKDRRVASASQHPGYKRARWKTRSGGNRRRCGRPCLPGCTPEWVRQCGATSLVFDATRTTVVSGSRAHRIAQGIRLERHALDSYAGPARVAALALAASLEA
jgi:translocation and assembly module TamB